MQDRLCILQYLLDLSKPLPELKNLLDGLGQDYDGPELKLTKGHLLNAFNEYFSGKLSAEELEEWANLIECRDGIDYAQDENVHSILHKLANPFLAEAISVESIKNYKTLLDS